jgi:hypothetical protein
MAIDMTTKNMHHTPTKTKIIYTIERETTPFVRAPCLPHPWAGGVARAMCLRPCVGLLVQ